MDYRRITAYLISNTNCLFLIYEHGLLGLNGLFLDDRPAVCFVREQRLVLFGGILKVHFQKYLKITSTYHLHKSTYFYSFNL